MNPRSDGEMPDRPSKGAEPINPHGAIAAMLAELKKDARACPKCGAAMAHYRLFGYRCPRGCQ